MSGVPIGAIRDDRRESDHPHPPRDLRSRGDLSRSSRCSSRERWSAPLGGAASRSEAAEGTCSNGLRAPRMP